MGDGNPTATRGFRPATRDYFGVAPGLLAGPWERDILTPAGALMRERTPAGSERAGYAHPAYAASLAGFGRPLRLPACGGWLLERDVPGSDMSDATGCYPLFRCARPHQLDDDITALEGRLISVTLVTDPLGQLDERRLPHCFPDRCAPYKEHFVVDLTRDPLSTITAHHRYYARRALRATRVDVVDDPSTYLDEWCALYDRLIERHRIRGFAMFSPEAFARQLEVPGLVMLRAANATETVGLHLWYAEAELAYHHLGAYSETGYRGAASYALMWTAIQRFAQCGIRWLDLGGAAGSGKARDGLSAFKRGWANETKLAWLCGRVLDRRRYDSLTRAAGATDAGWFPAYRAGEAASGMQGSP